MHIAIDFETYSPVDLKEYGLDNYFESPYFKITVIGATAPQAHLRPALNYITTMYGDMIQVINSHPNPLIPDIHPQCESKDLLSVALNVCDPELDWTELYDIVWTLTQDVNSIAHNADFENGVINQIFKRAQEEQEDLSPLPCIDYDTAAIARARGFDGSLAGVSTQLGVAVPKLSTGAKLMKYFAMPAKNQLAFNSQVIDEHFSEWIDYVTYCRVDSLATYLVYDALVFLEKELIESIRATGYRLLPNHLADHNIFKFLTFYDHRDDRLTSRMNRIGWHVNLDRIENFDRLRERNVEEALEHFKATIPDAADLNFKSVKQLRQFCLDRNVRMSSFTEERVNTMLDRIEKLPEAQKTQGILEVKLMLETKKILGGSALTKLSKILHYVGPDGRLRYNYVSRGAGQTCRTSGRDVQMQNLKRLKELPIEVLDDPNAAVTNLQIAENLRQVFEAEDPNGFMVVSDFSGVEARGLAYLAGDEEKLKLFEEGADIYKIQASQIFNIPVEEVTKYQRSIGKVAVLGCGYGAGTTAMGSFSESMGLKLSPKEVKHMVDAWRDTNPKVCDLWNRLGTAALQAWHSLVEYQPFIAAAPSYSSSNGVHWADTVVMFMRVPTPKNIPNPHAKSIAMVFLTYSKSEDGALFPSINVAEYRVLHGVYLSDNGMHYYKPKKDGSWSAISSVTKQPHRLYGGKLAAILTQSYCRELFFSGMHKVANVCENYVVGKPIKFVGQFHDEIVLEVPGGSDLQTLMDRITKEFTRLAPYKFPLTAETKHDKRYTK